jgi:hypothetical protein
LLGRWDSSFEICCRVVHVYGKNLKIDERLW